MSRVSLTVNGEAVEAEVEPRTHLADFLREARLLTGTHLGCCLLYTSPSPRDATLYRMPSSA